MHLRMILLGVLGVACSPLKASNPQHDTLPIYTDLEEWLNVQEKFALQSILANIGGALNVSKVDGASPGIVVASPSKANPDYFYTWTRDAALTMKTLAERHAVRPVQCLEKALKTYAAAQAKLQRVGNPSGDMDSGGLGEPKFHVNMTAFTDNWGRPQRDGPALRATALISFSQTLIDQRKTDFVKYTIWPVVIKDLTYVADNWNQTGFDLWEEIEGTSFFTLMAQLRSLIEGSKFATKLGFECTNCFTEAIKIRCLMYQMWDDNGNFMMADINNWHGRSNKGTNTIIASVHGFDPDANCDDTTFQPCSPRALANHKVVAESFQSWQINPHWSPGGAIPLGRYIEDTWMGGNPWYLTTSAAAEQLYYALNTWNRNGHLEVTDVSLSFFQLISNGVSVGTYDSDSDMFKTLTAGVRAKADGYLQIVQMYTPESGAMAEQFSRYNGQPLSAVDLTWSYAALLTAKAARDGHLPRSWGSNDLASASCDG